MTHENGGNGQLTFHKDWGLEADNPFAFTPKICVGTQSC